MACKQQEGQENGQEAFRAMDSTHNDNQTMGVSSAVLALTGFFFYPVGKFRTSQASHLIQS